MGIGQSQVSVNKFQRSITGSLCQKSLNKPIGDVSTFPWSKNSVCGLSNLSGRRRAILERGDNVS